MPCLKAFLISTETCILIHWDMVSIGPTIKFPHSPDEKIEIATVDKYWQLLIAVLAKR